MDKYVVITGGYYTKATVSKYDKTGWMMDLTSLNSGRYYHACGYYTLRSRNEISFLSYIVYCILYVLG